ncbi:MAG TPA: TonB-dependent receptor, partial [Flavisolibacter sp.]|nr:TonB-dependent receptor [Flavisolibacter sp.]
MKLLSTIVFLLFFSFLDAQTISGVIKDSKSLPVAGASISLKETYDGATSDSTGKFSFKTTEKGDQLLVITAIGYKPFEQKLNLNEPVSSLNVILKEEITELKAVVITAGSFEASDRKKATVLSSIDIVTTASANGDITGAIKTLPGAQQIGESEGLFVRGGTASETKVFIDGTLVNNFFYSSVPNIASRGRFSPFIFKGTVFSSGGYSALYGQALSSALILESIDLPDQSSANFGVTVIGASGGFQQLAKNKKSSWGINYGYTDLKLAFAALRQRQEYSTVPVFHTADANFRFKTTKTGIVKYYGYWSANKLAFTEPSIDTSGYKDFFKLSNSNIYHNLAWRENLGNSWQMNLGFSYTNNKDKISGSLQDGEEKTVSLQGFEWKSFGLDGKGKFANAKFVLEKKLRALSAVRFGGEYNYSLEQPTFMLYDGQKFPTQIKEKLASLFAETDIYVTNNIAAKLGSRLEHSSILNKTNIAPRASLAYKLSAESQASLAYGVFYQTPESRYLPSSAPLGYMKATHYIAQYQKAGNSRTLRGELFYKKYDDLLKTGLQNNQQVAINNNGNGDAKGFEIFWRDKKTIKAVDYWISYSYLDTKRDFLNYPGQIRPSFAAKHTASLVVKKYVEKISTQFNGAYNYASARPYYFIGSNGSGGTKFIDQGKTPAYQNISFSLNYLPSLKKSGNKNFVVYVLSISNVTGF